jgi:hypothetical protein
MAAAISSNSTSVPFAARKNVPKRASIKVVLGDRHNTAESHSAEGGRHGLT